MIQTRLFILALALFGSLSLSLFPQSANAQDRLPLVDMDPQIVKNIEDAVKRNTELAEQRAREAQKAAEDRAKSLSRNDDNDNRSERAENRRLEKQADDSDRKKRFDARKTRKCESKQQHISEKLDHISSRGSKQLNVFKAISTKVQNFYTTKGYAVPGYQEKVAELDALYDQSLVALTATQNASDSWNCLLHDPVASLEQFKETKRAETATILAYKAKVKELILLVKQAGGQTS